MFVQLIVGIYVLRYLGPEKFGILTYAFSFVMIFSILSNLGLENIIIRNLVRDNQLTFQILGTGFTLKIIGVICSIIVIYLALSLTNNETFTKKIVMIVSCWLIFDSFSVIDYFFRSQVQAKYSSIAQITMFLFNIVSVKDTVYHNQGASYLFCLDDCCRKHYSGCCIDILLLSPTIFNNEMVAKY